MRFDLLPRLWAVVGAAGVALLLAPVPLLAQQFDAPEPAGRSPAPAEDAASAQMRLLTGAIQGLQAQVQQLSGQVNEMRAEQQRSREQTEQLRREMELLRAQLAAPLRTAGYTAGPQQAPGPPLPYSQTPPAPGPQTAQEAGPPSTPTDEYQQLTDAKLSDLYQTKVESSSKYRLRLSGLVLLNMFVNRGNVDNLDVPQIATQRDITESSGAFGGSLRQSLIGLQAFGPDVLGAHTSADVQFDFAGGFPQAPNGAEFGIVRLRTGTVRLDWANTSLVAGQDSLFFAPLSPTSFASVAIPPLAYSGNLWTWTPQVRVEHRITVSDATSFLVEGGILDSWSGDVPPEQFSRYETWGEESGQPAYAMRLAWNQRLFGRTFTLGFGGYYGRQYWGVGRHVDGWAGTTDLTLPLGKLFTFTGEFYRGSATAGIGGGIGQDTLIGPGSFISPTTTVTGLHSLGGWSQLKFKPRPKLEFNGAFGQDNPIASQLRMFPANQGQYGTLLTRNRSAFVNCIYQPRSDMLFSVEYRRIRSFEIDNDSYPANQVNLSVGYIF
jgi:outer membrane murein-binding lipoprotein Lpp